MFLLDLKAESNRLINGYRNESLRLTGMGIVAIGCVLWYGLRRPDAMVRVLTPVLIAVGLDVVVLISLGERLSLFHLVSLLLVIGIGLNYALFFNRNPLDQEDARRTALSLVICCLATLSAFGALSFSRTPVLHAIGLTVSLGSLLSLVISAIAAKKWCPHFDETLQRVR
jgi:predicted exporter